ncbi:hypothetical protein MFLO_02388 [Listeria floridensis FSL S10-1187]|uniref:BppU N-terminal domain-containing protein n=1 Tax=Listeria floridensis FSL S10-1187 TaxID=1265817 RepID=A0ABP3B0T3_9LIST|nr:BppU family phage baseplate upper protein [Listeria floridensis]EUJ33514.1 hypothetical protein MFLO_02388 [Listeria floridensis FSL S10-1187]
MDNLNEVYKNAKQTLEVSAQNRTTIDLKATFSTYDKDTARLIFDIQDTESIPFPLSDLKATIYFKAENLKYQAAAEVDKENSRIIYILPEEVIHTIGVISAELYLDYTRGQALSVHKFHFRVDKALIDEDLEIISTVYIHELEDIKIEYLDEFESLSNELNKKVLQLQTDTSDLKNKLRTLEEQLAASNVLKKSGDVATGNIDNYSTEAFSSSYGTVRHYVGALSTGTVVRLYFSRTLEWKDYIEYTVGGEPVYNSEFGLEKITSNYLMGYAPADYKNTKSVIDGVEKVATGTIKATKAVEIGRNGSTAIVKMNGSDVLNDAVVSLQDNDLNNVILFMRNNYVSGSAKNAPVILGNNTAGSAFALPRSSNSIIQMYVQYQGRLFIRYLYGNPLAPTISTNTDTNGWMEFSSYKMSTDLGTKIDTLSNDLAPVKVNLTPKNGFVATETLSATYTKIGKRYLVSISGIVGQGTGSGTGVCATVPEFLKPDTTWNKMFPAAQQSTNAGNQANIYMQPSGDINIVAVGTASVNTGLDNIMYFTKEVS